MQRIDSFGTVASLPTEEAQVNTPGYFTQGNPSTSTPATVVAAWFLNQVQEELLAVIVAAGITPSKTTYNQLLQALGIITQATQEATFAVANNQVAPANVTGMVIDKTLYTSADIIADLYRKDAGQEHRARVKLTAIYLPVANTWELLGPELIGEDYDTMGVGFTINASTGQVQYVSSNYAGGSYVGELRFKMNRFKL